VRIDAGWRVRHYHSLGPKLAFASQNREANIITLDRLTDALQRRCRHATTQGRHIEDHIGQCWPKKQADERGSQHNPHVVVITGCNRWDQGLDVIVEGEAKRVSDHHTLEQLVAAWAAKWNGQWKFAVTEGGFVQADANVPGSVLVFEIRPTKVLAFGKGKFSQTRYLPR
jgi:hypothetical protein